MDVSLIALLVSIIALLGTFFNLNYTRRSVKISEKPLEKKKKFEETSKMIRQAIDMIKEYARKDYFPFSPLEFRRDNILAYMHDNKLKELNLIIAPEILKISYYDNTGRKEINFKNTPAFNTIKKIIAENKVVGGSFDFTCVPSIFEDNYIDLQDSFSAIGELYHSLKILNSFSDIIEVFDNLILKNLSEQIDAILRTIVESLMQRHIIIFTSEDTSKEIIKKLHNELTGRESVLILIDGLLEESCIQLVSLQKEIYLA